MLSKNLLNLALIVLSVNIAYAEVKISTEPNGAQIYIDGLLKRELDLTESQAYNIRLDSGTHEIRACIPLSEQYHWCSRSKRILIESGVDLSINLQLDCVQEIGCLEEWSDLELNEGKYVSSRDEQSLPITGLFVQKNDHDLIIRQALVLDGKVQHLSTEWHTDGSIKSAINYKNNRPHGKYEAWHENGVKRTDKEIIDGIEQTGSKYWYKNGQLSLEFYKKGELFVTDSWHENGNRSRHEVWDPRSDNLTLLEMGWFENGQKRYEKKPGLMKYWFDNGNLRLRITFDFDNDLRLEERWFRNSIKSEETKRRINSREYIYEHFWNRWGERVPTRQLRDL